MGITRQREMTRDYIVKVMKLVNEKFNNDQHCIPESTIKGAIVEEEDGDLDTVLETMVKKRILRFGPYGFGETKSEGYQRGSNYKVLYSSLEGLLK